MSVTFGDWALDHRSYLGGRTGIHNQLREDSRQPRRLLGLGGLAVSRAYRAKRTQIELSQYSAKLEVGSGGVQAGENEARGSVCRDISGLPIANNSRECTKPLMGAEIEGAILAPLRNGIRRNCSTNGYDVQVRQRTGWSIRARVDTVFRSGGKTFLMRLALGPFMLHSTLVGVRDI